MTVTVVLLLCVLALTVVGVWVGRRRHEVLAWDRELDAALHVGEHRDAPRHRVL